MAESELGLLESFRTTGEIDELHFYMHDFPVNLALSTLGRCPRLAGNHLDWFGSG